MVRLTDVDPLLEGEDLRRPGGGEQLRVGRVGTLKQRLALVEAVGNVPFRNLGRYPASLG